MTTRPIANKYLEGRLKVTLQRKGSRVRDKTVSNRHPDRDYGLTELHQQAERSQSSR